MRALEGQQLLEDDPTVMYLTAYLLTLDAQYDFLARHHRQMIARAEDAEKLNRQLHVDLTSAQACVASLESREVIVVEALKQAKDEHIQMLMEAYLVTHNQRRALRIQDPASSNPVQPMRGEDP
jgi:GTP cyclohydrolase FolE2